LIYETAIFVVNLCIHQSNKLDWWMESWSCVHVHFWCFDFHKYSNIN